MSFIGAAGKDVSYIIDGAGDLWVFGNYNENNPTVRTVVTTPTRIRNLPPMQQVSIYDTDSNRRNELLLDVHGCVWSLDKDVATATWSWKNTSVPLAPKTPFPPIVSISCGEERVSVLDENGTVFSLSWQRHPPESTFGQLMNNRVEGLPEIRSMASGKNFTLFIDIDGEAWYFGDCGAPFNQLSRSQSWKPLKLKTPAELVRQFATFATHVLLLDDEGSVWAIGANGYGQCGVKHCSAVSDWQQIKTLTQIESIAVGLHHSLFLDAEGIAWGTGSNEHGQLGMNCTLQEIIPYPVHDLSTVRSIIAGENHSLFVDIENKLWAAGKNQSGQCGLGHTNNVYEKKQPQLVEGLQVKSTTSKVTKSARK